MINLGDIAIEISLVSPTPADLRPHQMTLRCDLRFHGFTESNFQSLFKPPVIHHVISSATYLQDQQFSTQQIFPQHVPIPHYYGMQDLLEFTRNTEPEVTTIPSTLVLPLPLPYARPTPDSEMDEAARAYSPGMHNCTRGSRAG